MAVHEPPSSPNTDIPPVEQTARVVRCTEQGIWVEAVEPSGCGTCGGQGCGSRRIAELFQRRPRLFLVDSARALQAGDRVVIGIAAGSVLRAAGRAYGVPLLAMFAGALLAQHIGSGDGAAVVGALVGGLLGGWLGRGGELSRPQVLRFENEKLLHRVKGS